MESPKRVQPDVRSSNLTCYTFLSLRDEGSNIIHSGDVSAYPTIMLCHIVSSVLPRLSSLAIRTYALHPNIRVILKSGLFPVAASHGVLPFSALLGVRLYNQAASFIVTGQNAFGICTYIMHYSTHFVNQNPLCSLDLPVHRLGIGVVLSVSHTMFLVHSDPVFG